MKRDKMSKGMYVQIRKLLDMVSDAIQYIEAIGDSGEEDDQLIDKLETDLRYTTETVNMELLYSSKVQFCRLDDLAKKKGEPGYRQELLTQYFIWLGKITEILEKQYHAENVWDERFIRLMDYIRYVDIDEIVERVKDSLFGKSAEEIAHLCRYYQTFHEMWGTLDAPNDRYDVIINRVTALKEHREDFLWLYGRIGDQRSRLVLTCMLYSWITFDKNYIDEMKETNYTDYFDLDLVECDEKEVVVDLGAWTGDSALNYIQTYGRYKKMYCYEIDASSMEAMKKNLSEYPDIIFKNKGVGNKNSIGYVDGSMPSCNKLVEQNTGRKIEMVRLDDDIDEKVTLIKMDIEGAEQDALSGSVRHIREEHPKLLISVYHNNEDIWKIPRMIIDINPDYQLFLRSNGAQWGPSEIVLLAIDKNRKTTNRSKCKQED